MEHFPLFFITKPKKVNFTSASNVFANINLFEVNYYNNVPEHAFLLLKF